MHTKSAIKNYRYNSWIWTTVWQLWGGGMEEGIGQINGNGKIKLKKKFKKKEL